MILHIDFETRSKLDLSKVGVYRYAANHSTDVWCMAWAFDDDEDVNLWLPGQPLPLRIRAHINDGGAIHAWNAAFERVMWQVVMTRRDYRWPAVRTDQFFDTAAQAAAMALPRKLSNAAKALGLTLRIEEKKQARVRQMARPRKPTKNNPSVWWDTPDRLRALYEDCMQDVRVEREVGKHLVPLSDWERDTYLLDQKINDRGVPIDRKLVVASRKLATTGTRIANAELHKLTGVRKVTQVAQIKTWLEGRGFPMPEMSKDVVRDTLAECKLPDDVRRVIELRSTTAKSSLGKLDAMLRVMGVDDRARGLLLYHGAGTGRWAGRLIQPQNFTRPTIKDVERFLPLVLEGRYNEIDAEEPVIVVLADLMRSMLRARPGHRFLSGDFSQIEARIVAWIAEQEDLLELFANDGKVYETMGASIRTRKEGKHYTADDISKDSPFRQNGKNAILGCGFGMGVDRYIEQAREQSGVVIEQEDGEAAVYGYRELYPRIPEFWSEINDAAMEAVRSPGRMTACGRDNMIRYQVEGMYLWCTLPSGRRLAYCMPRISPRKTPWGEYRDSVTFVGENSTTHQWQRQAAYGGLLTENVVQAMARDLLVSAMKRTEKKGYKNILTVHDELLAEMPEGQGSVDEFLHLMRIRPRWADELPVKAEGWEGERYRK